MAKFIADAQTFEVDETRLGEFFADISNFKFIFPDEIEHFKVDGEQCAFTIKNIGNLSMEKGFVNPKSEYEFISTAESKVDFTLVFWFSKKADGSIVGQFEVQTDVNPLVEMMVKRPLMNFVNMLTVNLKTYIK